MRLILLTLIVFSIFTSKGQSKIGDFVVDKLEKSRFYFIGQAHNNKANSILEEEMLLALHLKYNVSYDILEYSHSFAFILNQYLRTGSDSLLTFINPNATFNFIKSVKAFNDNRKPENKIIFYGIDFENRQDGRFTKKAISIVLQQIELKNADSLASLLQTIVHCSAKDLNKNIQALKYYLLANEEKCRSALGEYYLDINLIAHAAFNFSPKRDRSMINSFNILFNELRRNGEAEKAVFFASFGIGHINPNNKNGIASFLKNDENSPVRNSVSIIGIQYFNCQFQEGILKPSYGVLNFLCTKSSIKSIISYQNTNTESIIYFPKTDFDKIKCNTSINQLSGLFIISNFGSSEFWMGQ